MKSLIRSTLLATTLGTMLSTTALSVSAQTKWDLPTGYGVNTLQVQNLQWFADEVDKATAGRLKFTLHANASLFKANEIKRAVQSSQTPIGEFIVSGAANDHPIYGLDSIPFLATSYAEAKRLNDVSRPALEKVLAGQGLKLLSAVPWPPQSLYSIKPVQALADLKGTRMRAYNPATSKIAELLGAQPVTVQLAELPQALATGAVHNFLTSSASGVDSKLHEHVKHFYAVAAWLPRNLVVVNQKAFDGLDKATQEALVKTAAAAETRGWRISEERDAEYLKELGTKGMVIDASAESLKRELRSIGERMTADWLATAGPEGKAVIEAYRK